MPLGRATIRRYQRSFSGRFWWRIRSGGRVVESIAANHHFLAPTDASSYRFVAGHYRVNVFALLLGDRKQKLLFTQELEVTPGLATQLEGGDIDC